MRDPKRPVVPGILAVTSIAVGLSLGARLLAQEVKAPERLTTEQYLDFERVNDAQISPDGARIIYTRQHVNKLEDKWESELWILNADGTQNRFLAKGSGAR